MQEKNFASNFKTLKKTHKNPSFISISNSFSLFLPQFSPTKGQLLVMAASAMVFASLPSSMALNISFHVVLTSFILGFKYQRNYIKPSSVFVPWNRTISSCNSHSNSIKPRMEVTGVQIVGKKRMKFWALWEFKPGLDPP
ncbi:hypothetical protein ACH5RR_028155 [Cinchona calisaya]|uniref:Uncharacterized protein n=1 Tax=Cinchona calisaya TaxID=153742 RepID=A0ABD2YMY4_9GENT